MLPRHPVVSVLVLTYNHEEYLPDAIDSVLLQRMGAGEVEILIGEDCSTDGTRDVALGYQRRYPSVVRVISADRNVGMHANHRRLIEASRGEYLAYCEGDDFWHDPGKLARQVEFLASRPDYGAVHSEFTHIARVRGRWRAVPRGWETAGVVIPEGDILDSLIKQNTIMTCTVVLRAELARRYLAAGLPVDRYPVGDWPLFIFVSSVSKVGYLDVALATYRKLPGSMTNAGSDAEIARTLDSLEMVASLCDYLDVAPELRYEAQRELTEHLLKRSLEGGDSTKAHAAIAWLKAHDGGRTLRARLVAALALHGLTGPVYRTYRRVREVMHTRREFKSEPPSTPWEAR